MGIIEYHEGCNVRPDGCFGPWDNFYSVFGTELRLLTGHIIVSIILGLVLLSILFTLRKKEKIKVSLILLILIPITFTVILFFALAYLLPVRVVY